MLPEGWRAATLQSISKKTISYGVVQTGAHVDDGIPCIRVVDLPKMQVSSMVRTSDKINKSYKRTVLEEGDILFALRGNIGNVVEVPRHLAGVNITRGLARISPDPQCVTPGFLTQALRSPRAQRDIQLRVNGSALQEVPISELRMIEILLPPLPEQHRILQPLEACDRIIAQQEAYVHAKRRFKRGLMQQLLTGKRRFTEYDLGRGVQETPLGKLPADWHTRRIRDLFKKVERRNEAGVDRVLTVSGRQGLVDQREYFNRSVAGKSLSGYYLLRRGEFAYNRSTMKDRPYGAIKRLDRHDEGVVSTLYICFALMNEDCESDFFAHFFECGLLNRQLRGIAQIGARAHGLLNVPESAFFDLLVPIPSNAEQQRIARVLSAVDREIDLLNEQLRCLKEQKRGLMQKLLTGQVRVQV
jgi:type I restriction enzyme, S subunit